MAVSAGPNLVEDGLVLCLDAANSKSYPGTGTTWTDLSGNGNNGTLVNSPTYSSDNLGNFSFDGVNDYVVAGADLPLSLRGNPSFTVSGFFKRTGNLLNDGIWGIGGGTTGTGINTFNRVTNEIGIDFWGTTTFGTGQLYSATDWQHIVWTYNGTTFSNANIQIYINNTLFTGTDLITREGGSGTPNINSNPIVLGRTSTALAAQWATINISNIQVYDRVLSADEIAQNFNALRGRYGI